MRTRSSSLPLFTSLGLVLALTLAAKPAAATQMVFFIDPTASSFAVAQGSGFNLHFGPPLGDRLAVFQSQTGNLAGVSGPGDGLATALSGQILANVNPTQIQLIPSLTSVTPELSGSWLSGLPAAPTTPSPAQLGVYFEDDLLDIQGAAALRGAAFSFGTAPTPLVVESPSSKSFVSFASVTVVGGMVDFDTNLLGIEGRGFLREASFFTGVRNGLLETLPDDLLRMTLPFDVTITLGSDFFPGLPVDAKLHLEGQIVAYNRPIPEPSTALLIAFGGLGLAAARRTPRRGDR